MQHDAAYTSSSFMSYPASNSGGRSTTPSVLQYRHLGSASPGPSQLSPSPRPASSSALSRSNLNLLEALYSPRTGGEMHSSRSVDEEEEEIFSPVHTARSRTTTGARPNKGQKDKSQTLVRYLPPVEHIPRWHIDQCLRRLGVANPEGYLRLLNDGQDGAVSVAQLIEELQVRDPERLPTLAAAMLGPHFRPQPSVGQAVIPPMPQPYGVSHYAPSGSVHGIPFTSQNVTMCHPTTYATQGPATINAFIPSYALPVVPAYGAVGVPGQSHMVGDPVHGFYWCQQ